MLQDKALVFTRYTKMLQSEYGRHVKYPYLVRLGALGLLKYRRAVPPNLRSLIGKSEIQISFGTSDLAEALPFYHCVAAETAERFEKMDDVAD